MIFTISSGRLLNNTKHFVRPYVLIMYSGVLYRMLGGVSIYKFYFYDVFQYYVNLTDPVPAVIVVSLLPPGVAVESVNPPPGFEIVKAFG
jgi:hypothetical protein